MDLKAEIKGITELLLGRDPMAPPHWSKETPEQRGQKLSHISTLIAALRPDAIEIQEIIEAMALALRCRYDNPTEALLRMSLLKKDLDRLDLGQEIDARDVLAAYERAVEKKEGW